MIARMLLLDLIYFMGLLMKKISEDEISKMIATDDIASIKKMNLELAYKYNTLLNACNPILLLLGVYK